MRSGRFTTTLERTYGSRAPASVAKLPASVLERCSDMSRVDGSIVRLPLGQTTDIGTHRIDAVQETCDAVAERVENRSPKPSTTLNRWCSSH
jgi:hypothetical protein